jgi:hypothetical protein
LYHFILEEVEAASEGALADSVALADFKAKVLSLVLEGHMLAQEVEQWLTLAEAKHMLVLALAVNREVNKAVNSQDQAGPYQ